LPQDRVVAFVDAREKLVAHCHVIAKRLAEGWRPWSAHDVDMLVQVGGAIAVLDRLIKEEPALDSARTTVSSPEFANTLSPAPADHIGA
jgi:hypothetical protein